jgi:pantetheine-phosphate adenylyltransferase
MQKIAIYPGSFDPITNGHVDLINRGVKMFDEFVIVVGHNPNKPTFLFSVEERLQMIREVVKNFDRVRVDVATGLMVDYAQSIGASVIVRGLRALSDFEYEFQLALINRRLNRNVETVFLMSGFKWFYTSSQIIKEAAGLGGSVKGLVPDYVYNKLQQKFGRETTA